MEVIPLGDSALLVRLENDLDKPSYESLGNVLDVLWHLQAAQIPGGSRSHVGFTQRSQFSTRFVSLKPGHRSRARD